MRAIKALIFNSYLFCNGVDRNLFAVSAYSFKLNGAVDKREKRIVFADAYVVAGLELRAALSNQNVACKNVLTVSALYAEHFGVAVSAVVGRTRSFLMSE